jgi:hypothetical protein
MDKRKSSSGSDGHDTVIMPFFSDHPERKIIAQQPLIASALIVLTNPTAALRRSSLRICTRNEFVLQELFWA